MDAPEQASEEVGPWGTRGDVPHHQQRDHQREAGKTETFQEVPGSEDAGGREHRPGASPAPPATKWAAVWPEDTPDSRGFHVLLLDVSVLISLF